jgi:hypothetical protein
VEKHVNNISFVQYWDMTYLRAIPTLNTHIATDVGEMSNGTLVLPSVLGN